MKHDKGWLGYKRQRTIFGVLGAVLLLSLCYYQFFYHSTEVDGRIFTLARVFNEQTSDIWAVRFSPDDAWLASGSVDSTAKVWRTGDGQLVVDLRQPSGITYLDFSPSGKYLATAAYDAKIRLWRLPDGTFIKEFAGHRGTAWSLCFSPDGTMLVSGGEDGYLRFWDIERGAAKETLLAHSLTVWDVKFSPDGKELASGSFDKTVKIWRVADGKLLRTLTEHTEAIVALAYSHDGRRLASASDDGTIKIWDTSKWSLERSLEVPEHVQAVDFSPRDERLVTGGRDKPAIGELLQNLLGDSEYNKGISMRLWDVKTGALLQTFSQHANDVNDVAYSSDGNWIASGSSDKRVMLWKTGK